jgi:monovalent cation:H+ antiporter-2, CPA2 family
MEGINFIQDLAIVLLGAGIAGSLCKRVGLSVVFGYLLAGIVIGPYTPPFPLVLDVQRIETLSQIGLVFLMFAIGLGLSLTNLRKMGASTLLATALGAFFVLNLTQILGHLVGWPPQQALFVAAMFMVSSSAVIAKIIRDMNLSHERSGQLALGVTVLEDVVAVVMLAVLGAQVDATGAQAIGLSGLLTNLSAFVVLLVLTGLFFIPKLLRRFEADPDWELLTTIIAGVVLFMSLLAVKAGYSLALGAFLLGAIIAEMPQKVGVEKSFSGLRDMFSSVFFVSIGMMIDVQLMFGVWPWVLGLGLFTLAARAVSTGLALILLGTPPHQARQAGLTLMPVGEFTFVIAQLGVASQVLPPEFYPIAVGVSLFTVFLTPLINRHAGPLLQAIEKAEPLWLHRSLEVYHNWLDQLGTLQSGQSWWLMSKKYLLLIALEMLFVTGLLGFSERLLSAFQQSPFANALSPEKTLLVFWVVIGLLVLVPLFAICRNFLALANVFAGVAASRTRLLGPIVDTCFKAFSAIGLAYWLYLVLPDASLPQWAWLAIAVGLTATLVVFSRRLIYWHSQWQDSLKEALADHSPPGVPPLWLDRSDGWGLSVQEFIIPARAACAGRAIAELGVRSRYGCSVVEIDRQGHTIIAPEPAQTLYSGDRLLLLGSPAQIASARAGLSEIKAGADVTIFDQARLEAVTLPEGPLVGQSLAQLQIPRRTGVLVTAINRRGEIITNPMGSERLFKGDELLVLGSPEQIRALREWLAQEEDRPNRQQPLTPGETM